MNVNVVMTEQEFDSFRQWRGKLEELDATKLHESLVSEILRHCPQNDHFGEYSRMKALGDGLHNVLKHWKLCQQNKPVEVWP